ncbi:MAG: spore coat U domain-containing protein [Pseudomonadota bacterium]
MFFNHRMSFMLGLAAVVALVGANKDASANTLEVTATVPDSCTVDGGTLAFGTVDPSASTPIATGQININCTSAADDVDVTLDAGLHDGDAGNGRAMKRTTSNDYLNYKLYANSSYSQEWAQDVSTRHDLASGPNAIPVYGRIDQQNKPGGDYADTIQITLTFN